MIWLKSLNLYLVVGLVALGGAVVSGIYIKGARDEQRKWVLEMAERNKPLVKLSATDEFEVPANDKAGEETAAVVTGAITQQCVITVETARLVSSVK